MDLTDRTLREQVLGLSGTEQTPAAYVTLGTVSQFSQAEALQRAIDAAAQVVSSVVVTTGPNPIKDITAPSPSVFVVQYLPQSTMLERVDVVV